MSWKTASLVELIFLLPASVLLGPSLLYVIFFILPLGIASSHSFAEATGIFQIALIALIPLLGLMAAWFVKLRGVDRVAQSIPIRIIACICLALGAIDGVSELLWIVTSGRNPAANEIFWAFLILPAVLVGIYQLFKLTVAKKNSTKS